MSPAVLDNLLTSMKFVLHGMGVLRINLANSRNKVHAHSVLSCGRCFDEEQVLFPFVSHALYCLWADQGVRAAVARGYEYELNDSALYFFENMSRITSPDYVPTETDVLRVRLRTTGVIETQFKVNHLIFSRHHACARFLQERLSYQLHFPSRDALISVYSHVICPRCEMEMGGLIQYVNMAPISWLHIHLVAAHTFKSISGSVLSVEKQRAGIRAQEADVR
ncbi:guanine nucleotide-binding protein G(o) subunit alpha-like protein [Lates japonicus]|uniref:Guanine nucleotide-binding protein G(O) subunit alpha-like protein n=1 Tax=Lates japonicus TaxID=270547 RepID=A0AAD3RMD2_LATJO|nr:guanine nucleotide-binding protein G(o) subunit alpha-like protein [Lates japonicus]